MAYALKWVFNDLIVSLMNCWLAGWSGSDTYYIARLWGDQQQQLLLQQQWAWVIVSVSERKKCEPKEA